MSLRPHCRPLSFPDLTDAFQSLLLEHRSQIDVLAPTATGNIALHLIVYQPVSTRYKLARSILPGQPHDLATLIDTHADYLMHDIGRLALLADENRSGYGKADETCPARLGNPI